ncbi:MAG TPA: NADH-quinone oxidoreductase subunit C [Edaphobacter sp.]|jgi:NADH-quinone oxidoreductase subunit C|nr:NADH-quinone oxidoreductase subunit C [Edaphobacter sp.]
MDLEKIKSAVETAIPDSRVQIVLNGSPSAQHSLVLDPTHAVEIAKFLRDDTELRLDYCSNASGVDWLDTETSEKVKVKKLIEGEEKEVEEVRKTRTPGYLEAVYHLYSMEKKHGPLVIRQRTENRSDKVTIPSLTPIWRSAEFQEREIYDLYGIVFQGHPDLRRILMWDEFEDHPMRKDYVEPNDYEYEPTPHDAVLEKAKQARTLEGQS